MRWVRVDSVRVDVYGVVEIYHMIDNGILDLVFICDARSCIYLRVSMSAYHRRLSLELCRATLCVSPYSNLKTNSNKNIPDFHYKTVDPCPPSPSDPPTSSPVSPAPHSQDPQLSPIAASVDSNSNSSSPAVSVPFVPSLPAYYVPPSPSPSQ